MKKSRYSETQIVQILKEHEAGVKVDEISRKYGISSASFYKWKSRYGGMELSDVKRMKEMESENFKLKRMYSELALENHALKELITKKL
jgi:putative transposase